MKKRMRFLSLIGLVAGGTLALILLLASGGTTGEYHSGQNLYCYDCHTIHASMQHGFDGGSVSTTFATGGNWLSASVPNLHLLKAPANQLCLACHDNQTNAPDVLGADSSNQANRRMAGALNDTGGAAPYETWKGHTLDSVATPPGFDPTLVGAAATWYVPTNGLECISCHAQHGPAASYRNLGPYALGGAATNARPTYTFSSALPAVTTNDVWIALDKAVATASIGNRPGPFGGYYDFRNIFYFRNDATVGSTKTSNKMDTFCGTCHGQFHGGPVDTNIGPTATPNNAGYTGFLRHPTSQITIGGTGAGGQSLLSGAGYAPGVTKTKVYTNDYTAFTNSSPGCVSCHKSHGNQNPFGLFFLGQNAVGGVDGITEQGGYNTGQTADVATGQRNLCGQCHTQGN